MLSTMTKEGDAERTDREVLAPWIKFLWDTFRTVLETLRTNLRAVVPQRNFFFVVFVCLAFLRYESGCIHFGDIVFEADTMRKQLTELANGLKEVATKIAPEKKVGLGLKMSGSGTL